jgi:ParB-like chromosome segregation protein Spo0J
LRDYGQVWPILVDETDEIIAGHGRRHAMALEGFTEIKVLVARGWTEKQCRAFALLDNRVPLNAGWDADRLAAELLHLRTEGVELKGLGFSPGDLKKLEADPQAGVAPQLSGSLIFSIMVRCDSEQHQAEMLQTLADMGLKCEAIIS